MTDLNIMFKALKLAWIPRILASDKRNWCTIPDHFLKKMGGLNFLLRCNYDATFYNDLPTFYKRILDSFNELKTLYNYHQKPRYSFVQQQRNTCGWQTDFFSKWFKKGYYFN